MSTIDFKPALFEDEWSSWKYWLRKEPEKTKKRVAKKLMEILEFTHSACVIQDFKKLHEVLFVPFDAQWNRVCSLMIMEIENANNRHVGAKDKKDFLVGEWAITGINRPVFTHVRDKLGDGRNTTDIPTYEVATVTGVVE